MANIVLSLLATFNGKALTKGKKEVSAFDKQVKQLGRTFAATFGAGALLRFSKKAIKAFAEDEAAAKSLELQLRNTGFAFSSPAIEQYIGNLQKLSGVLDDELRPAFQQLLTVTGSITKSQDALQTALNVSAATGRSLREVSAALTRGFSGNTAGLSRLGAGISKATLKTGDMDKIMEELNSKFAGQAAARLTTYAGKMSLLTVAAADSQEIIGEGLLDALTALGDNNSVENLSAQMTDLAESTADVVAGVGALAAKFKVLGNVPFVNELLLGPVVTRASKLLGALGAATRPGRELPASEQRSAGRIDAKRFQTEDKLAKAKAAELLLLLKKNAIENKNVEELRKKFDLERIGLTAALNSATDEETKLRLKAQLAILDNNDALAKKLSAEMEAAEALKKLAEQARLAGLSIMDFALVSVRSLVSRINAQIELINKEFGIPTTTTGGTKPFMPPATTPYNPLSSLMPTTLDLSSTGAYNPLSGMRTNSQAPMDIRLTIDGGSDKLSQAIAESIQVATRSGYSTVPNGFIV